jgi:hypothetical protein
MPGARRQGISTVFATPPCAVPEPLGSEAEASPEGIVFRNDHDLVSVDFIGRDGAEGSIPCPEDDDRDHERGGEGSTHCVDAKA